MYIHATCTKEEAHELIKQLREEGIPFECESWTLDEHLSPCPERLFDIDFTYHEKLI